MAELDWKNPKDPDDSYNLEGKKDSLNGNERDQKIVQEIEWLKNKVKDLDSTVNELKDEVKKLRNEKRSEGGASLDRPQEQPLRELTPIALVPLSAPSPTQFVASSPTQSAASSPTQSAASSPTHSLAPSRIPDQVPPSRVDSPQKRKSGVKLPRKVRIAKKRLVDHRQEDDSENKAPNTEAVDRRNRPSERSRGKKECNICGKFVSSTNFSVHMRIHQPTGLDKRFCCSDCGQRFRHGQTLKTHMYRHTKEKPFKCERCGKCFADRATWRNHLLKKKKPCRRLSSLSHSNEGSNKRFQCLQCPKFYTQKPNLARHQATEHIGRKFFCKYCSGSYTTKWSLTAHIEAQHSLIRRHCKFCNRQFKYISSLERHLEGRCKQVKQRK